MLRCNCTCFDATYTGLILAAGQLRGCPLDRLVRAHDGGERACAVGGRAWGHERVHARLVHVHADKAARNANTTREHAPRAPPPHRGATPPWRPYLVMNMDLVMNMNMTKAMTTVKSSTVLLQYLFNFTTIWIASSYQYQYNACVINQLSCYHIRGLIMAMERS